jgi:hypothetical protein
MRFFEELKILIYLFDSEGPTEPTLPESKPESLHKIDSRVLEISLQLEVLLKEAYKHRYPPCRLQETEMRGIPISQ